MWRGNFDSRIIQETWSKESSDFKEGYVVRVTREFYSVERESPSACRWG